MNQPMIPPTLLPEFPTDDPTDDSTFGQIDSYKNPAANLVSNSAADLAASSLASSELSRSVLGTDHGFSELTSNLLARPDGGRDYVDILQAEYRRRKTKNPLYSVRAFAMHLRIHVSALSRILNRKQALSLKAATVIVKNLDLAPAEQERLLLSIAAQRVDDIVNRLSKPLDSRLRISFDQL